MDRTVAGLATLKRPQRIALRELLIRATAAAGRGADRELERLVRSAPIGWLPLAAGLHRVAGTVARGLDVVDGVPDDVRADLLAQRRRWSLHHLLVVGVLSRIGSAFDEAGLRWVAMKGPVVAALLYPDVGDRSYADLDLLVDRRDFGQAIEILEGLGYGHSIHNWALAEQMLAGEVSMSNEVVAVDLHWHLHYSREDRRPFALDPEAMIERHRLVTVSGVTVPALDPVDSLLTLAFHAARSDGHRLVWLKDVERSVWVEVPDLRELVRRCHAARCAPPVGVILGRARSMLDATIPEDIIRQLVPVPLRAAERFATALAQPLQLHERATLARTFTRSVRSSSAASIAAVPTRAARDLRRRLFPPTVNESDSPEEKASYLRAVAAAVRS